MSENYQAVYDAVRSRLSNCDIGQAVQDVIRQTWDISFAVQGISQTAHAAADEFLTAAQEQQRPFVLMRPKLYPDGNQWCALYGDNLQEGVAGFGDTPQQASIQFDIEWMNRKAKS